MTRLDQTAHRISLFFHPAVVMILTAILLSNYVRGNPGWVLIDMAILIAGILPGLIYIYVKTKRGDFGHYHLLLKEERRAVFPILIVGLIGSFALYFLIGTPLLMLRGMVAGIVGGVGAAIINRYWKISIHAAVTMGCAALFLPVSIPFMLGFMALGVIVGLARLPIKHHTPGQVIVGWLYGFFFTSALLWLMGG
jgi:membrane-associated phospholipid phosphatase